jgi:Zn-dependent protease
MGIFELLSGSVSPITIAVYLFAIVVALTIHEFAHAWVADKLGDPTPRFDGRVTLNPLAHLDPIGALFFLVFGFGWGKPVVYNPMRLRGKLDELWVALAGPASNLVLAFLLLILSAVLQFTGLDWVINPAILALAALINVFLAAFNMLPIPPLDGSAIIATFYPQYRSYVSGMVGFIILLILIYIPIGGSPLLTTIVNPIVSLFSWIVSLGGLLT